MNFNVRAIKDEDMPEIIRWFNDRRWPMPVVENSGPRNGVLAEKNGIIYACIYSYLTGTAVAYLEWPGTNPDIHLDQSMEAFDEIVFHYKRMSELAEPKVRVLCLMTHSEHLANRFKKHGFKVQGDYYKAVWTLKE
jgi:hypothetical protein